MVKGISDDLALQISAVGISAIGAQHVFAPKSMQDSMFTMREPGRNDSLSRMAGHGAFAGCAVSLVATGDGASQQTKTQMLRVVSVAWGAATGMLAMHMQQGKAKRNTYNNVSVGMGSLMTGMCAYKGFVEKKMF